jgi:long-chain acyl-CoA synthetase
MDDLALLQYTGGTTGIAKGAMLTHRNLMANVIQLIAYCPFKRGQERLLCVAPFFHVLGMTVLMNFSVCMSASMILLPRFEINNLLKTTVKTRPTIAVLVPTIFAAMVNNPEIARCDISSINYCFSGSAPLPIEIMDQFEEITGGIILEAYGLTEASPVTHANPIQGKRKPGSVEAIGIGRKKPRKPSGMAGCILGT